MLSQVMHNPPHEKEHEWGTMTLSRTLVWNYNAWDKGDDDMPKFPGLVFD